MITMAKKKTEQNSTTFRLHLLLLYQISILIEVKGNKPWKKSTFWFKPQLSSMFRLDFMKIDI